jgi:hypothetical protein
VLTVNTAADSQNLISLSDVKAAFGVTDGNQDVDLRRLISQASAMIASYCNRVFIEENVTETFRPLRSHGTHFSLFGHGHHHGGNREQYLILARRPVTQIASVTEGGNAVDGVGYGLDPKEGTLERLWGDRSAYWQGTSIVTYTGGYPLAEVPADLVGAVIDLIRYLKQRADFDPTLRTIDIPGVLTKTYQSPMATGIPDHIACVIDEYRNPSIG